MADFTEFFGGRGADEFEDGIGIQILSDMPQHGFFIDPQSPPRTRKKKNPVFLFFQLKSNSRINVGKLCVRRKALCTSSENRINMNKVRFD